MQRLDDAPMRAARECASSTTASPTNFVALLIQITRREQLDQSRHAPSRRKQVSRFRETVRRMLPLEGEPIRSGVRGFPCSDQAREDRTLQIASMLILHLKFPNLLLHTASTCLMHQSDRPTTKPYERD